MRRMETWSGLIGALALSFLLLFGGPWAEAASGTKDQTTADPPRTQKPSAKKKVTKSTKTPTTSSKTVQSKAGSSKAKTGKSKITSPSKSKSAQSNTGKSQAISQKKSSSPTGKGASKSKSVSKSKQPPKQVSLEEYKAAVVINAKTGEVVHEENAHRKLVPASLTKMMLALVAMERVRKGANGLSELVAASERTVGVGGTQIDLQLGEALSLEDMLQAILIRSANDAAASVAEHMGGSQESFVQMMNAHAMKLGMKDTTFINVHGLPSKNGLENVSTAFDMAVLAKELLNYPEILHWSSKEVAFIRDGRYPIHSTNKLLGTCEGVDGLKTGFIRKAGFNIAATAQRQGTRLIAVVLGSPSSHTRNNATKVLLSKGFDQCQARSAPPGKGFAKGAERGRVLGMNPASQPPRRTDLSGAGIRS